MVDKKRSALRTVSASRGVARPGVAAGLGSFAVGRGAASKDDCHAAWAQTLCNCGSASRLGQVGNVGRLGRFNVQGLNKKR